MKKVFNVLCKIVKWYAAASAAVWAAIGIGRIIDISDMVVEENPDISVKTGILTTCDIVWDMTINAFKRFFGWIKN